MARAWMRDAETGKVVIDSMTPGFLYQSEYARRVRSTEGLSASDL
jgi:hypothetical protein